MTGGSLSDRLSNGYPLSVQEANNILKRICAALAYAHTKHIIHRDIKSANILFDEMGLAYLADFGLARTMTATMQMSHVGTSVYMSPEQIKGEQQDARTDIYLMGVVLFEMLTGQLPFGASPNTFLMHLQSEVPSVSKYNSGVPPACDAVIRKAMAKAKDERYRSATEFATAFRSASSPVLNRRARTRPADQTGLSKGTIGFWLLVILGGMWWLNSQGTINNDIFGLSAIIVGAILGIMFVLPMLIDMLKLFLRVLWGLLKILLVLAFIGFIVYFILGVLGLL
jgi:serine/threonine protein kinase